MNSSRCETNKEFLLRHLGFFLKLTCIALSGPRLEILMENASLKASSTQKFENIQISSFMAHLMWHWKNQKNVI